MISIETIESGSYDDYFFYSKWEWKVQINVKDVEIPLKIYKHLRFWYTDRPIEAFSEMISFVSVWFIFSRDSVVWRHS